MRSLLTFLVLAIALLASNANAFTQISKKDAEICGKKNPDVVQAIAAFCQRAPYKIPNRDARIGRYSKNLKFYVKIESNCKPAEKLNKTWCFRQFYNMCRNGRKNGSAVGAYGGGGCQHWMIFQKGYYKPT